jgi:hypothetical protein
MKRLIATLAVTVAALLIGASASAAIVQYANDAYWGPGEGYGSGFSSSWFRNTMYKSGSFDSTITFIDNVSYSWHNTRRSSGGYIETFWKSPPSVKAHCRSNVTAAIWAGCTVYS